MDGSNQNAQPGDTGRVPGRINPLHGIVTLLVTAALLIFVAAPIQAALGVTGLVITEIMILVMSLLPVFIFGLDFRRVFPFKVPKGRQIAGTVLVWTGFWGLTITATVIVGYFFPDRLFSVGTGMSDFFSSVPLVVLAFAAALMPAVCEEALFRGLLQHSLHRINKWAAVAVVGVLFGLFHLDPVRMVPTGILGVGLAYVMLKSENMVLPMTFHFLHNMSSVVLSAASALVMETLRQSGIETASAAGLSSVASGTVFISFFYVLCAPAAILTGGVLLEPRRPSAAGRFRDKTPQIIVAGVCTGIFLFFFIYGIVIGFRQGAFMY